MWKDNIIQSFVKENKESQNKKIEDIKRNLSKGEGFNHNDKC